MAEKRCVPDAAGPMEYPYIREEIVRYRTPRKAKKSPYTVGAWSFRTADGKYAYWDYESDTKRSFYHEITIEDPELLECLDYFDRKEEKGERQCADRESYSQLNFERKYSEEDDPPGSPADLEAYRRWAEDEDGTRSRPLPLDSEYAVIRCIVQQLPPKERRVFDLVYDSYLTQAEIKKMYELSHSAWSNEKKRFHDDIRRIFEALGYEVLSDEEIEEHVREKEKERVASAASDVTDISDVTDEERKQRANEEKELAELAEAIAAEREEEKEANRYRERRRRRH